MTTPIKHIALMAVYNQSMNENIYTAARSLPASELLADKKAFFGSILGTLNHIAVADTIWLKRFSTHTANYTTLSQLSLMEPTSLDQQLFSNLASLHQYRMHLDKAIIEWVDFIKEPDLNVALTYKKQNISSTKNFFSLLMHFFNHQTHHRGQVSTLLFQAGIDIGITDLLARIPNE